jgi:hypothetical protein
VIAKPLRTLPELDRKSSSKEEHMIRVGYLEGTDPHFLNEMALRGVDIVPLSDGGNSHGKYIGHLTMKRWQ